MKELRTLLNISQKEFSSTLGVSQGTISDIENGRKGPSRSVLISLNKKFGVNANWLLIGGNEKVFRAKEDDVTLFEEEQSIVKRRGVPFYDIDVAAHIAEMFESAVAPSFFVDFEPFNDCSAYLPIYGDSMFPLIQSGDIVAIKKLTNTDVILWGEAHLVITSPDANNLRTVKLVYQNENPEKITLRASNPNFRGDTIVDKAAILSIYIVKGIITRKQW